VLDHVYAKDSGLDPFLARAIALCLRYPDGFVSGAAAARYWGLRRGVPGHHEFTVPEPARPRGVSFALFHSTTRIDEVDVFPSPDGLRVSAPGRAIFEAASRLDQYGLRSMVQDAFKDGLVTAESLDDVASRLCTAGRRGSRLFQSVVSSIPSEAPVHSEDELLLLDALRARGLDVVPQCPVRLSSGFTIHLDVGIPDSMFGVEVDGPLHDDPIATHRDHARDLLAAVQGWQVARVPVSVLRTQLRALVPQLEHIARKRSRLLVPGPGSVSS